MALLVTHPLHTCTSLHIHTSIKKISNQSMALLVTHPLHLHRIPVPHRRVMQTKLVSVSVRPIHPAPLTMLNNFHIDSTLPSSKHRITPGSGSYVRFIILRLTRTEISVTNPANSLIPSIAYLRRFVATSISENAPK